MPHHKQNAKRLRQDARRRVHNRMVKSRCRTLEKRLRTAISEGDRENAGVILRDVQKALDQAAGHRILRKDTVSRKKSRFMAQYNQLASA